jgi:hypothetical protein
MLVHYTDEHRNGNRLFHGWWRLCDNVLRTVVAAPPPDSPVPLALSERCFESASSLCA